MLSSGFSVHCEYCNAPTRAMRVIGATLSLETGKHFDILREHSVICAVGLTSLGDVARHGSTDSDEQGCLGRILMLSDLEWEGDIFTCDFVSETGLLFGIQERNSFGRTAFKANLGDEPVEDSRLGQFRAKSPPGATGAIKDKDADKGIFVLGVGAG